MYPDTPATAEQVERVTAIIAKNSQRLAPNNPGKFNWQVYDWDWPDWTAINWDVATPQLQTVISPSQLAALQEYFRVMEAHTAGSKRWVELMAEARKISQQPGD